MYTGRSKEALCVLVAEQFHKHTGWLPLWPITRNGAATSNEGLHDDDQSEPAGSAAARWDLDTSES